MSFRFLKILVVGLIFTSACICSAEPIRICADPDNLPFSDRSGRGFDQRIAVLLARELHRTPVFVWTRPRRGFLREQFNKNACDVLLGVPTGMRSIATTTPYYTSSYVFITPAREHLQLTSFTDPALQHGRIGIQILEEDLAPPSLPLIRLGHAAQIVGFESFGKHSGDVVRAIASGKVDFGVVWGPVAGYFARSSTTPLTLTPVPPTYRFAGVPFTFPISLGVHKRDAKLLSALNSAIVHKQAAIDGVLSAYHVPLTRSAAEGL